jgi:Zn-dependent M32 family carboxypeptidase
MAKFGSALALLSWDRETNMPPKGVLAGFRGHNTELRADRDSI